jgi:MEDS: MEthanogen/methylotroph, DcmR Sensory domain
VPAVTHDHGAAQFEHRALVYTDISAVVREVARTIEDDLRHDHAVLMCVVEPIGALVARQIEPDERLHFLDLSDRYTRPIDAMNVLWRFTRRQLDTGVVRVHSIGELSFTGTSSDDDWFWYEAACNEVLDDLALTATCLYGLRPELRVFRAVQRAFSARRPGTQTTFLL